MFHKSLGLFLPFVYFINEKNFRQKHIFTLKIRFYHVGVLAFLRNRIYYPMTVKFLGEKF